jgi:outer membrane lipoprotein LolB
MGNNPVPPIASNKAQAYMRYQSRLSRATHFTAEGVLAIHAGKHAQSADFTWRQQGNRYHILLSGPFGAEAIRLVGQPGSVRLTLSNGKTYSAANAQALMQAQLGYHMPVAPLQYWIRNLSAPGYKTHFTLNRYGLLKTLDQAGWHVVFKGDVLNNNGVVYPTMMLLSRGSVRVKMVISKFNA